MRLLLALLLGNAAANPLLSLVSKAKSLVTAKNLQLGGGIGAALPVLNTLREAASDAEDKRQGIKETIRSKARKTAEYVVWYHRNQAETKTGYCTKDEFCKMLSMARPIMKAKMKKRGRLARWLTTTPSEELVEIYVREEIGEVMKADEITLEIEDGYCPSWTKDAKENKKAGLAAIGQKVATELQNGSTGSRGLGRLLGVVAAEVAVVAALLLK
jgi:hypothetical protein